MPHIRTGRAALINLRNIQPELTLSAGCNSDFKVCIDPFGIWNVSVQNANGIANIFPIKSHKEKAEPTKINSARLWALSGDLADERKKYGIPVLQFRGVRKKADREALDVRQFES